MRFHYFSDARADIPKGIIVMFYFYFLSLRLNLQTLERVLSVISLCLCGLDKGTIVSLSALHQVISPIYVYVSKCHIDGIIVLISGIRTINTCLSQL